MTIRRCPVPIGGKNPDIAALLSLLCVGAGQIYNGEIVKGVVMLVGGALAIATLGSAAVLVGIPLILYGIIDAGRKAQAINAELTRAVEERDASDAVSAKLDAETVSAQDIVAQIEKLHRLASSNLLNSDEYAARKKQVLTVLHTRRPREAAEDFLTALIPLARSEALSADELAQIKSLVL